MSSPDFDLISSTRRDPCLADLAWNANANAGIPSPYLLLNYHRDRLLDAAKVHNWPLPTDLSVNRLEELCDAAVSESGPERPGDSYRIRIVLSYVGTLSVTASPTTPLPTRDPAALSLWLPASSEPPIPSLDPLIIHLDTTPTPSSPFTRTKTTRREHYTAARDRFSIPPLPTPSRHDVLLFNQDGEITETSIRNIAFVRRSPPRWLTPAASSGCLTGVMRRWLLEQGRVIESVEGELTRDGISEGEYVLTFNGVEGCRIGRVKLGHELPFVY